MPPKVAPITHRAAVRLTKLSAFPRKNAMVAAVTVMQNSMTG